MVKQALSIAAMAFMTSGVWAKDIRTATFTTLPQMHCQSCETKIKNNLRFEKGVKRIETNVEKQTVVITYDADKVDVDRLIKGFEKIKYKAEQVKPEPLSEAKRVNK